MYISANEIYAHWQQNKDRKLNFQGADEAELEAALKASMEEWNKHENQSEGGSSMVGHVMNAKADVPTIQAFQG